MTNDTTPKALRPSDEDWGDRRQVHVDGRAYLVRRTDTGNLEVCVDGVWRSQTLFRVYDHVSFQMVAEILVTRHRTQAR